MGDILSLMGYVQQQGEQGRARGLSQLLGKAYNAPPDQRQAVLGQVANVDGGMAMDAQKAFGQQDEAVHDQIIKRAAMVSSLYKANPQMAQAAYQGLPELAQRGGFGQVPAQLDDKVAAALEQMVAAAHQSGTGGNVQSTYIDDKGQRVAIMRDGSVQVLGANAPNNQIIDTGNGFFGVNKGNLQAAPVMMGGAQAPQQPGVTPTGNGLAPEESVYAVDGQPVPQEDIATIARVAAAGDAGQDVNIPAPSYGGGMPMGGQLRSAPKPVNPMDQARLQLAQQAAQRDEARLRLQQQAAGAKTAPKPADEAKAQKIAAARADALDSVTQAISGIDTLTKSGGFQNLGTFKGDLLGMIPHTQTKDAGNALETVKNQVLLTTLGKLKALSATGASGFGALSNSEGNILKNSIANIETAQSHEAIVHNLNVIRQTLQRAAGLIGGQQQDAPAASGWSI
jgi:hypothetical protein